jgi:hypothetical protein
MRPLHEEHHDSKAFIRDPRHLEVGFREHAPEGRVIGGAARAIGYEKHIRYLYRSIYQHL